MKKNECKKTEIDITTADKAVFLALMYASSRLEQWGYCPHAPNNNLCDFYKTCKIACKKGVPGCHECISKEFLTRANLYYAICPQDKK